MANFNFRFERVLNYKKTIEDYKKSQYGVAQKKLIAEEDKLNEINQIITNVKDEKNISTEETSVGNLVMYNNYINDLSKKLNLQKQIVENIRKDAEKAKEEMINAVKEKKIFEKLKEQEYKKHIYHLQKNEEKHIDSIISYKTSTQ
ncbi:flagellar FliJ protein [Keratinibaculum paraultunense]|uniref:Flagellar FliJ protein n=1 Tax=Keratinibaculum paraultunense TaxID=1278232 RepID=A0A4R3KWY0_9FIRM|nr:flagellar export protein FliJ [Keratinibaculum paraultunense]QQY80736.1 flagellar export protein FliJ [Keratinibaculum paraultunense]TCS89656.1 flagellar FliJ protein [Keratinibaculum paraultunense]